MEKKHAIQFSLFFVAIMGVLAGETYYQHGPVYEGKSLENWLRHPTLTMDTNFVIYGSFVLTFPRADSNAVPFLIKALAREDTLFNRQYTKLWEKWKKQNNRFHRSLPLPVFPGEIRANAAIMLCKMGTDARPAIPALIHVLKTDESPDARFSAAICLLAIGKDDPTVERAFLGAWTDSSQNVRNIASRSLQPTPPPPGNFFDKDLLEFHPLEFR